VPLLTRCPKCQATFNLPDNLRGKNAQCSRCKQVFLVPAVPAAVPEDVPTVELAAAPTPARPRPAPARRAPDVRRPPARSSGTGWIIALAVGVPLLLLFLIVGVIILFAAVGAFFYVGAPTPAGPPVSVAMPNPVPAPPVPNDPAPNPGGPDFPPVQPVVPPPPREPPPPLKPPAPVEVAPAVLAQDKVVKPLPSPVGDAAVGGGGRFLILSLPQQKKLAIFDVSAGEVVKYLSFSAPVAAFAAGMDKLIVAGPDNQLVRYSLKTFEQEQAAPAPVSGKVVALCMGCASNGPLWVQAKGTQPLGGAATLVDPSTLKEWPADWGEKRPPADASFLRASEDGRVFGMRTGGLGEPHTLAVVSLHGGRADIVSQWNLPSAILAPDADGLTLYTGCAVYGPTLAPIFPNPRPQGFCKPFLPAVGGPYFARLDYKQWDKIGGDVSFFVAGDKEPFVSLKDVEGVTNEQTGYGKNRDTLTYDQRLHFLPAAKLLVAIPGTNDQLILYPFDPEAALEKSNVDYLVVTSRPPPSAKKGQEYAYSLTVKSKKGGVTYKLDSGPKGMAVDAAGRLTWTPPADADAENDVIVSVKDAGGGESFQSFRVEAGE